MTEYILSNVEFGRLKIKDIEIKIEEEKKIIDNTEITDHIMIINMSKEIEETINNTTDNINKKETTKIRTITEREITITIKTIIIENIQEDMKIIIGNRKIIDKNTKKNKIKRSIANVIFI